MGNLSQNNGMGLVFSTNGGLGDEYVYTDPSWTEYSQSKKISDSIKNME